MTVKELVAELQKLDQDRLILVNGYEGGYCDVKRVVEREVIIKPRDYCGKYTDSEELEWLCSWSDDEEIKNTKRIPAYLIPR